MAVELKRNTFYYAAGSAVSVGIAFLSVPAMTSILDAVNFGQFALIGAMVAAIHGISTSATGYFVNSRYKQASAAIKPGILGSILVISIGFGFLGASVVFLLLQTLLYAISEYRLSSPMALVLAMSVVPLAVWANVSQVLVLDEKAMQFAIGSTVPQFIGVAVTLLLIHLTTLRTDGLVLGATAANFSAGLAGIAGIFREPIWHATPRCFRQVMREVFHLAPTAIAGSFLEILRPFVERALLAKFSSVAELGIYAHSQMYGQVLFRVSKSLVNATFPLTIMEATETPPLFDRTRRIWEMAYYAIVVALFGFVFFGAQFIVLWTHGKFVGAYPLGYAFMLGACLQLLGRPAFALLCAKGRGRAASIINLVSAVSGIALLVVLVPLFGATGAVCASLGAIVVNRMCLLRLTWPVGIKEDLYLIKGFMLSACAFIFNYAVGGSIVWSVLGFVLAVALWSLVSWSTTVSVFELVLRAATGRR